MGLRGGQPQHLNSMQHSYTVAVLPLSLSLSVQEDGSGVEVMLAAVALKPFRADVLLLRGISRSLGGFWFQAVSGLILRVGTIALGSLIGNRGGLCRAGSGHGG